MSDNDFLVWLVQRLKYYHGYSHDNSVVIQLEHIINNKVHFPDMDDEILDKIISQHYIDFLLNRDETTSIGWTDEERNIFKMTIKQIVKQIIGHHESVVHNDLELEDILH